MLASPYPGKSRKHPPGQPASPSVTKVNNHFQGLTSRAGSNVRRPNSLGKPRDMDRLRSPPEERGRRRGGEAGAAQLGARRSPSGHASRLDMRKPYDDRGWEHMARGWGAACHRPSGQQHNTHNRVPGQQDGAHEVAAQRAMIEGV